MQSIKSRQVPKSIPTSLRSAVRLSWLLGYWPWVVLLTHGLMVGPVWGDDWLAFRGPSGQGIATVDQLPTQWSESENVRWHTPIAGLGWSSPVVKGDRIYLTTAVPLPDSKKHSLRLVCLQAETGEMQFDREVFQQRDESANFHQKNSHASPTPVIGGDRIYVHFGHEGFACLDLEGNLIWSNRDYHYEPTHGNGSSPLLFRNLLIMTCDGSADPFTLAIDITTGKEVWKVARDTETDRKFSFCTPLMIEVDGKPQVISAGSNIVQALDPSDGRVLWYARFNGFSLTTRPIYLDGKVILATGFMRPQLMAIEPTGTGDVTASHLLWQYKGSVPNTPSLIGHAGQLVMVSDNGIASAIGVSDGKEIWKQRLGGNFSASPLIAGNRVYFQSEEGETIIFEMGTTPTEVARNQLPGRTFASFAIYREQLLIRSEKGLYCIAKP